MTYKKMKLLQIKARKEKMTDGGDMVWGDENLKECKINIYVNILVNVNFFSKPVESPGLVAHFCDPSYSGGSNQEDFGLKPAWKIVCETLSRKISNKKIGLVECLTSKCEALSSNVSTAKEKVSEGF
jgi:hypothetical protein